jgi:hypothetical protein
VEGSVAATRARWNALNWPVIEATTFHAPRIDVRCEANGYLHLPVQRHRGLRQALLGPDARPYFGETIQEDDELLRFQTSGATLEIAAA